MTQRRNAPSTTTSPLSAEVSRRALLTAGVAGTMGLWALSRADRAQASAFGAASIVDVTDYGAVGDGTTINNAAINAAVNAAAAGDVIFFPTGTYAVNGQFTFSKSLTFRGAGATIKKVGAALTGNMLSINANNTHIEDLAFEDPTGLVTATFLNIIGGHSGCRVERCRFTAPAALAVHFNNHSGGVAADNTITATRTGIQLTGGCTGMTVSGNEISSWKERGIYCPGTASGSSSNVTIDGNTVKDLAPGGVSRYPIMLTRGAAPANLSQIQISNNTVIGPDKSWRADDPGTADQISLMNCDGFEVFGNHSHYGGDMGITISGGSSQGAVHDNDCRFADVAGICVWTGVNDVEVTGNECMNNGQNRLGDRSVYGRAGIYARESSDLTIGGNTVGDDQAVKTQNYGVTMYDTTSITLGTNIDAGNKIALYYEN